jgi:hypothetical protein
MIGKNKNKEFSSLFFCTDNCTNHYWAKFDSVRESVFEGAKKCFNSACCGAIQEANGTMGPQIDSTCPILIDPESGLTEDTVLWGARANTTSVVTPSLNCVKDLFNDLCKIKIDDTSRTILIIFAVLIAVGIVAYGGHSIYKCYRERHGNDDIAVPLQPGFSEISNKEEDKPIKCWDIVMPRPEKAINLLNLSTTPTSPSKQDQGHISLNRNNTESINLSPNPPTSSLEQDQQSYKGI